jgi:hypothetical protein
MTGIQFVTDEKGRKVAVQIDLGNYSVEVKPSARKELEALPDNVLQRVIQKMESLGDMAPPGRRLACGLPDR